MPFGTVDPCWCAARNDIISLGRRPDDLAADEAELRALLRTATDALTRGLLDRG